MLAPPLTQNSGRISQLLPSVKCSSCGLPVPLADLGDHSCAPPPPVPSLPKPSVTPSAATALLPPRLQNRVASPANSFSSTQPPAPKQVPLRTQTPQSQLDRNQLNDRLRINTTTPSDSYHPRTSSLARPGPDRIDPPNTARYVPNTTSPLRIRPPESEYIRVRSQSTTSTITPAYSTPNTPRPSFSSGQEVYRPPVTANGGPSISPQRDTSYRPRIPENDIDTKSGGEAGMAGVGRRGFAAVARAAMFATPLDRQPGVHTEAYRSNAPRFLDIDTVSRSTDTPPLSAGSGYSSHSPGPMSPFPQSPGAVVSAKMPRTPSPPDRFISSSPPKPPINTEQSSTAIRLPFFEKYRQNSLNITTVANPPIPNGAESPNDPQMRARSFSTSTTSSRRERDVKALMSPSSGSEIGLAYADSTDDEQRDRNNRVSRSKANPPPPLPLTSSILRSGSNASSNHVHFPSISDRSGVRLGPAKTSDHKRNNSNSSLSSTSSGGDDSGKGSKSNSALIAHALGLSRTPPSSYSKLGGPGVSGIGGRIGRSTSGSSSSSASRSIYSRSTSIGYLNGLPTTATGGLERAMETLLEDVSVSGSEDGYRSGLSKSKSTGKQRSFANGSISESNSGPTVNDDKELSAIVKPAKTQRSNTVQSIHSSPENRPPKLPARSKTEKTLDASASRQKERSRKPRVCVRCDKKIEDGRWVKVDGGGVLCERCWKNMYLPKCRRCNLPIEKQAVSSSDGQLKGKYHKECFNCHTCHKPFPDKSFYVYDGKPLCAYHYHEANDSLCSAARCGQPIEGPCAVSHTGDRYHPEHMTCEYHGYPECKERLVEYWEVDGRMLCERHANAGTTAGSDEEDEEWVQNARARKRVTRFIDLAGLNGGSELM